MSSVIQSAAVLAISTGITAGTFALEHLWLRDLLDLNLSSATIKPLTTYPTAFYVRQDRKDKERNIKVFSADGTQLYTFERLSSHNPVWTMQTFPQRREVATIMIGFVSRSVDFHNKPEVAHREITTEFGFNGMSRTFYVLDGAKYQWTTGSKFLERVVNPNGRTEEIRERIAKVKLMRQFRLDFEVLVDEEQIDREIALATAFTSMFTQWGVGEVTKTIGPTFIPPKPLAEPVKSEEEEDEEEGNEIVLVVENDQEGEITFQQ